MIPNRHMHIILAQLLPLAAEYPPAVHGVVFAGVEIGVIAYLHREMHRHIAERYQTDLAETDVVTQHLRVRRGSQEERLDVPPYEAVGGAAERSEGVEAGLGEGVG